MSHGERFITGLAFIVCFTIVYGIIHFLVTFSHIGIVVVIGMGICFIAYMLGYLADVLDKMTSGRK